MSEPFLGEIRMFPFNFAPTGWALCNGQILAISQFTALFSLLGTQFGGNGTTNFQLPNLQGNAPLDFGQGAGLSNYVVGEAGGVETVTVLQTEMPLHNHNVNVVPGGGFTITNPSGHYFGKSTLQDYEPATGALTPTLPSNLALTGGSLPHNNMPPYLVINFCIAMNGIYPSRE